MLRLVNVLLESELASCCSEQENHIEKLVNHARCRIGVNNGETAGQTLFNAHIHLSPRRLGDVENPRRGIRVMIPG